MSDFLLFISFYYLCQWYAVATRCDFNHLSDEVAPGDFGDWVPTLPSSCNLLKVVVVENGRSTLCSS